MQGLKPEQISSWPPLAVYDLEATDWVNIVCVCHVDEFGNRVTFETLEPYLDWLYSDAFKGDHVWAHWGGHYDHRFVLAYATKKGWQWQTIQSGNLLIVCKIINDKGREIKFCESARLMPDSVEKIGKTVGLRKLDVDRSHIEDLTKEQTIEYCFRDCDIVLQGLVYMRKVLTTVNADFAYTLASVATRWVRRSDVLQWKKFLAFNTEINRLEYDKQMLKADEFCMPAYFGGRVEVFRTGTFKKRLYYYDITSSYPWSMLHDIPSYFLEFRPPPRDVLTALNSVGVSDATISIKPGSLYIPVLPLRFKGKLIFPEGTFRGRWPNIELLKLFEKSKNGNIQITLHAQAKYESMAFLKPFVDTFYNLRFKAKEEGDEFKSYTFKILLNSLYGKLVESVERKQILHGAELVKEAIRVYGQDAVSQTPVNGVYALSTEEMGPFRHVGAGSYITARSRIRLLEGMEACLKEGANVYYCDTDSIITDKEIQEFKKAGKNELGSFKLEHRLVEAEFVAAKVYRIVTEDGEEIYKVKGMPVKGISKEERRLRWDIYNYYTNPGCKYRVDKANLSEAEKKHFSSKEGIGGFNNDLNKGIIDPHKVMLTRQLINTDKKRVHTNNNSRPWVMDGEDAA